MWFWVILGTLFFNCIWFGLGFWSFCIRSNQYASLIVKKNKVSSEVYQSVAHSIKFLGGFNFAVAFLSMAMLLDLDLFPTGKQRFLLFSFFALAHGSQFVVNVPVANEEYHGKQAHWSVLGGPMWTIFVVDGLLCGLNIGTAVSCLL
jgi:hypothetical protein